MSAAPHRTRTTASGMLANCPWMASQPAAVIDVASPIEPFTGERRYRSTPSRNHRMRAAAPVSRSAWDGKLARCDAVGCMVIIALHYRFTGGSDA
jgi:hypothetical protein